jgi:hypothetical protein
MTIHKSAGVSPLPREAVGTYWFVNTETAKNLPAARLRMREFHGLGFTEVWIAVRYLDEIGDACSDLLCDNYRVFLETVLAEADGLGLRVIPFPMPCGLQGLGISCYDTVISATAVADGSGTLTLDFGQTPEGWASEFNPFAAFAYRTAPTDLGTTVLAESVRSLDDILPVVKTSWDSGVLTARIDPCPADAGEEVFVALCQQTQQPTRVEPGPQWHATDVTSPAFAALLKRVVEFHESVCGPHPSYAGLAFDEPNIADTSNHPVSRRERVRRFYFSRSLAGRLEEEHGFDLRRRMYAMVRPASDIGFGLRIAYYECIQDALMEAMGESMKSTRVAMLGTHDWSGDRDRAIYNTFDQLDFTRTRSFGATDISGCQWDFDYAAQEPLIAFAQKETYARERAMLMTDHFGERVDLDWLLLTCERHAALGVDYMLLHAFGEITKDPPLWTRTESWIAYREPRALETWAARMKQLATLSEYAGDPDTLVVYPRYTRLIRSGDRYVVREWDKLMLSLARAHYSAMTITQRDLDQVSFSDGTATFGGRTFRTLILPCLSAMDSAQFVKIVAFHESGGNVLVTKPDYLFADSMGRPCRRLRERFEQLFGISREPEVRRLRKGEDVAWAGRTYHAQSLPEGVSEFDDCCLDLGQGPLVTDQVSAAGGHAILLGFEITMLSYAEDMHQSFSTDTVALLDNLLAPLARKAFTCAASDGAEDYRTVGLLRRRGDDRLLSVHRGHESPAVLRACNATVYLPGGSAAGVAPGVNAFVHHVEEPGHVVCNPFGHTLFEADLGREIASTLTYDEQWHYVHHAGSNLMMALPPGRELRLREIRFGPRDPMLPSDIVCGAGRVLEARTSVAAPGRTIVRVAGEGSTSVELQISLHAGHGRKVVVRGITSAKPAVVDVREDADRLTVTATVEILPNIENDIEVLQTDETS